jgi:integrase
MTDDVLITGLSPPQRSPSTTLSPIAALADIPEEEIWLAKQKSKRTRRAYKLDVQHFMKTLHIKSYDERRQVDHRAVIAWERIMREIDQAEPSTIRRRLAALSSLFKHLKRHHHVENNPVADVERPAINRTEGSTLAFSKADAAKLLNTPAEDTIEGLRDRAILSVGLQEGLRRAEIAALSVEDLHQNRGFDSLRIVRKGGKRDALAIHPNVAQRIRAYLDATGHAGNLDGPQEPGKPPLHGPRRHRPRAAQACRGDRAHAGIFGALDARNLYYDGAGKRRNTRRRAACGRARRARHYQAL